MYYDFLGAKVEVFKLLSELNTAKDGITASEIAEKLSLSRQVVSHYLSRLLEEGKVAKTATKPVYWSVISKMKTEDVFESFIGYHGSQSEIIQRCQAAVKYPPNGLNILITGQRGVGKSFLASLIYQYAINQEVIKKTPLTLF
ncbi:MULTISPECIES: HTH domain-containing protein [Heyndrickxia]|uniref:HTH domain-containing protein n=1 Tax=Heyndrickxia TaxID=2837504 RepID=UPI0009C040C3